METTTTITPEIQAKLARISNRTTKYELAIAGPAGEKYLLRYTRNTRHEIAAQICHHGRKLVKLTGSEDYSLERAHSGGHWMGVLGAWRVIFTGRTQREAIMGGELPYAGELPE